MSKNSAMEFTNKHVTFRNLFLIGLAFTGLNPFFVVWWFTAGAQLILIALEFMSFTGVILMYVCHVWMDYVWLITTAHLVKLGMDVSGFKWYRLIMLVFNVVLIFFGLRFIFNSIML
jgi:threonine/homoserine/homoserine lactone efflux protein